MATVSASLQLFDNFSQRLNSVNQAVESTTRHMECLQAIARNNIRISADGSNAIFQLNAVQRAIQAINDRILIHIDAANAIRELEVVKNHIRGMGAGSVVNIVVNSADILREITLIRDRIRMMFTRSVVDITLNAGDIISQARRIRQQIESQLRHIHARIQVELPIALQAMFGNLQMLVLRLIRVVRQLRTTSGANAAELQNALQRIADLERKIAQLQEQINGSLRRGEGASSGLLANLKGMAAAYLSLQGIKELFSATVGGAMDQQKMEDMFVARTGQEDVGRAMFDRFKKNALEAGQDVNESLKGSLSFFSATQNVDQLEKLNNLAQRLNAFDSAGNGMEGAAFALKEALSADIVSLAERFNMGKSDIRASGIVDFAKKGDIDGFIKDFDKLLESQKMGQKAFDTMLASPAKQLEIMKNNVRSMFADAGGAATKSLLPMIQMLNTAFQQGKFDAFFANLSQGLDWVVQNAIKVFNVISQVYGFISSNWQNIAPIVKGVAAAFIAWNLAMKAVAVTQGIIAFATGSSTAVIFAQTLVTRGLSAAWATLNATMKANVFIAILTVLVAIVTWMYEVYQTNDMVAAAMLLKWDQILNFFDQVPIFFAKVGVGIAQAFMNAKASVMQTMQDMTNGVIRSVNDMLDALGRTGMVDVKFIDEVRFADDSKIAADNFKNKSDAKIAAMEANAAAKAKQRHEETMEYTRQRYFDKRKQNQTAAADKPFDFTKWNAAADAAKKANAGDDKKKNVGKVDKVGKIEDKVDISSEDLKVMRDIAEMKSIQNFVTLTPTVQVKTGDINNGADVDTIIKKIGDHLEEQFVSTAQGVYT
ncbi:hypothetical protein KSP24_09365 [Paenibacillus sp. AK121]|nr:hypothetical protein [Paenibacillus sp. AK121]MBU9707132.1 hypothetical protein [Paenibacillus sp. AK121]